MFQAPDAVPAALTRHVDRIEEALRDVVSSDGALCRAARYALGWDESGASIGGGKRVRPSLCLLSAEAVGGALEDAMPGAMALELAHNFSLVHDDVQDRDDERHGRPTVWRRYGEAQAINVGDYLYTRAVEVLADADHPPGTRLAALQALLQALTRMLHGQWSDIAFESSDQPSEVEYIHMVADKTGALIGASLEIGYILGGGRPGDAAMLRQWGEDLGIAFQVWDDYLGIWGDPAETGKSNASDISRKKRSLPILLAIAEGGRARDIVLAEYGREAPDVATVAGALDAAGIREVVMGIADERALSAIDAIERLPVPARAQAELADVARFLVHRDR